MKTRQEIENTSVVDTAAVSECYALCANKTTAKYTGQHSTVHYDKIYILCINDDTANTI